MPSFLSYDGTAIWYDVAGGGEGGNRLVVLPGGPGLDVRYLGDLGGLDRHRRLVLVDGRAAGRSQVPRDQGTVSFVAQARDVEALRRHMGLAPVDVLAHSAGCLVAQEFAATYPERVGRLVLVAPVGRVSREPDEAELAALRASRSGQPWYEDGIEACRQLARGPWSRDELAELRRRVTPFYWYRWSPERWAAEYRPEYANPHPWLREAFYAGSAGPETLAERVARLGAVRTPVLVLAGAADGLIGTAPARDVAAAYPDSRLEILTKSGHRPWAEEPERFVATVTAFLDARDDRPPAR